MALSRFLNQQAYTEIRSIAHQNTSCCNSVPYRHYRKQFWHMQHQHEGYKRHYTACPSYFYIPRLLQVRPDYKDCMHHYMYHLQHSYRFSPHQCLC